MNKKGVLYLLLFSLSTTLCSTVYFLFYYQLLGLEFSFRTLLFISLFSVCITTLLYIRVSTWWFSFVSLLIGVIVVFGLVNFVHIDVFNTFAPFGIAGSGGLHTILETASEFYIGVPVSLYIVTVLYFALYCILILFLFRKLKYIDHHRVSFCAQKIEMSHHNTYVSVLIKSISLCIIFTASLFAASYVQKNPRQGWWQHNYTVSDLGVDGYLFSVLQKIIIPQHLSGDMAYAKSTANSTSSLPLAYDEVTQEVSPTIEKDSPENYYDYLKYYLKKLNHPYATHTDEVEIPNFTTSSPHILIYQLESIGTWGINNDPSPMPYFKKLMQDNIHVDHFFANGCHTIDAEFVTLCGFFPDPGAAIADVGTDIEYNECLPNLLEREKGYRTAVFHVNDTFFWNRHILDPKWGFDNFFFAPDTYPDKKLDDFIPLGKAIEYIKKSDRPVFAQVIGMVSHTYHNEKDLQKIEKESDVSIPRFTQKIDPDLVSQNEDLDEQQMREYFAYLTAVDNDIKRLFEMLKKEQILDNTIVVIVNDHRLYNFPEVDRTNFYLYNEIPFVMYVPEMENVLARDIASHIDIAPSILDLVMGKNFVKPDNFLGTSIFSKDHPNYALSTCNNRVNYVNPNEIIIGDRAINQYVSIWQDKQMGDYEVTKIGNAVQTITSMIKSMIRGNLLVNR